MISFSACGHKNLLGTHKNTFEVTKDKDLTLNGDCIIGVNSDFDLEKIKSFIQNKEKIKIILEVDSLKEEINCSVNKDFNDSHEIVVRRSDFASERTLGIKADRVCIDFSREFVEKMKDKDSKINILIKNQY